MKKFYFLFILFFGGTLFAQTYHYHFNNNLNEQGGGPSLVDTLTCGATVSGYSSQTVCTAGSKTVLDFNAGEGLVFENAGGFIPVLPNYTINILLKFNSLIGTGNPTGAQRIITFDTTNDDGIYEYNNRVVFFGGSDTVGPNIVTANTYFLVSIVRNNAIDSVLLYLNGVLSQRHYDPFGLYGPLVPNNAIFFFVDDFTSSYTCENGPGSISYLSITPTAFTDTQVDSTWNAQCPVILPLQLLDFHATKYNNSVNLSWTTAQEVNTSYFEIERGNDGTHFSKLGVVAANNTSSVNSYSFSDQNPLQTNFYRLKMVDIDGSYKYSSVLKINLEGVQKFDVFPNPANSSITVTGVSENQIVKLLSSDGKLLIQKRASGQSMTMDISTYSPGFYILQYFDGTNIQNRKFIKQ